MKISLKNQIWLLFTITTFFIISIVLSSVFYFYHKNWVNQEKIEINETFNEIKSYWEKNFLEKIFKNQYYIFLPEKNIFSKITKNISIEKIKYPEVKINEKYFIFQAFQDKDLWIVIIWKDISKYKKTEKSFIIILIKISLFLFFMVIFIGLYFGKIAIIPVKKLQKTLQNIKPEKLDSYKFIDNLSWSDELFLLQKTFKNLLEKIQDHQKQQEEFVAFSSHELRTPLTSLKSSLELAEKYPEKIQDALEEVDFLSKLVNQILLLTKIKNNFYEKNKINISELVKRELEKYKEKIENNWRKIKIKIDENIFFTTNNELFIRIFENFLENTIKFTPKNWKIFIELKNNFLEIKNNYKKIKEWEKKWKEEFELKKITEAFYQWDSSKLESWAWLWLYFVKKCSNILGIKLEFKIEKNLFIAKINF